MRSVGSSPTSKVRIGILGAGGVVQECHLPVLCNMPDVEVSWLCDKVKEKAQRLARAFVPSANIFTRIEECTDVDIVLVAIPVGYRHEPVQHAFTRGWNVLCEKPFALSLAEHDDILNQASARGVQIGVGLMRRYYRANIVAKQLIEAGVLGEITEIWASQGTRMRGTGRQDWYQADRKAAGGGVLIETGSHLVDQVFTVLNVQDFRIQDCWQQTFSDLDFETKVVASLATSYQHEIKFTLALSNVNDLYPGIVIRFSMGVLKLGLFAPDRLLLCTPAGQPLAHLESEIGAREIYQAFYLEWQEFIAQCLSPNGYKSAISADTARQSTAFIEACYGMCRAKITEVL